MRQIALRLTWPAVCGPGQIALHGLWIRRALSSSLRAVTNYSRWSAQGSRGSLRVVTTGWRRVVTTRLAQGSAWGRALAKLQQLDFGCRRFAPEDRIDGANGPRDRRDAGWGRVGACRAQWLTSISSLSAAGFQEMWPVRAPA